MEQEKEVKSYQINYICDKCGKGKMIATGISLHCGSLASYEHVCDECGIRERFDKEYPTIRYKEI